MSIPLFQFVFLEQKYWISDRKEPACLFHYKLQYMAYLNLFFGGVGGGKGKQTLEGVRYSSHIDGSDSYCASFLVFDKAHKAVVGESISLVSMVTRKILWKSKGWNKPE